MTEPRARGIAAVVLFAAAAVFAESLIPLLLLGAMALVIPVSLLVQKLNVKNLSLEIGLADTAEKGQHPCGTVTVINRGAMPFPVLGITAETENILTGEKTEVFFRGAVLSNDCSVFDAEVASDYCGKVTLRAASVRVYDLFGFFRLKTELTAEKSVLVLPGIFPMDITVSKSGVTEPECDTFSPYKSGNDPSETFAVRDYQPGDSLSRIHWKLTAKFDKLAVREASLPMDESILIIFERCVPSEKDFSPPAVRGVLGEILAALSFRLTEMNIAHTVAWMSHSAGAFAGHRIDSEESFHLILPEMLSVGEMVSDTDTIEDCLLSAARENYSNIVYLSPRASVNINLLPLMSKKTQLVCVTGADAPEEEDGIITVTPQNYEAEAGSILI